MGRIHAFYENCIELPIIALLFLFIVLPAILVTDFGKYFWRSWTR